MTAISPIKKVLDTRCQLRRDAQTLLLFFLGTHRKLCWIDIKSSRPQKPRPASHPAHTQSHLMRFPFRSPNLPTLSTPPVHTVRNLIPAGARSSVRTLFYQRHSPPPSQLVLRLCIAVNPQCLLRRQIWVQMRSHLLTVLPHLPGSSSCTAPSALLPPPFGNRERWTQNPSSPPSYRSRPPSAGSPLEPSCVSSSSCLSSLYAGHTPAGSHSHATLGTSQADCPLPGAAPGLRLWDGAFFPTKCPLAAFSKTVLQKLKSSVLTTRATQIQKAPKQGEVPASPSFPSTPQVSREAAPLS